MEQTAPHQNTAPVEEDVIDLRELIGQVLNHRWLIGGMTVAFVAIAIFYCLIRTPLYSANLLLNTNVNSGSNNALNGLVGETISLFSRDGAQSETETSILTSRSVLEPVVSKLHLDIVATPKHFPIIGHYSQRKYDAQNFNNVPAKAPLGLDKYSWGGAQIQVQTLSVSPGLKGHAFELKTLSDTQYALLSGDTLIGKGVVGKTETFKPTAYSQVTLNVAKLNANPGTLFTVAQMKMGDAIKALSGRLKITPVGKQTSLLTLTLKGIKPAETAATLNAIGESAVLFDIHSQAREAAKTLAFLKSRMPATKTALTLAEKKLNDYRTQSGNIQLTAETKLMIAKMSQIQTEIESIKIQLAQLTQQYTQKSFQVRQAETTLAKLNQQKNELNTQLKTLPSADQIQVGLMRDVKIQNAIYTMLQNRIQQFEILEAGTVGKVAIIDEAAVPYNPINKPSSLVVALAAFLGLFLSIGYIFARQFLFPHLEDPEIIERKLGIPLIGNIQESSAQAKQLKQYKNRDISHLKFLSEIDTHDLTVESLRSLRTNILFELPTAKNNIIGICGPTPNVGKSFTSANFAQILADANHKVLLIDCDIRKGDLYQFFTTKKAPGFCELARGEVDLEQVLHRSRMPNLDFIPTGLVTEKHAEFLMSPKIKALLDQFASDYDIVVIDTAPILAVTDAIQIFRHCGMNILTFAYGKHEMRELEHTVSRFEKAGVSINGFIFNRINTSHSYYGKKYKYDYRYNYHS